MTLREHLKARNLSFEDVARRLSVSVPLISHWCSGKVKLSAERAQALHKEFGIPLSDLRPDLWQAEDEDLAGAAEAAA